MQIFLILFGLAILIALSLFLKFRKMPQYKLSKEKDDDGKYMWFVKLRVGLSYKYLELVQDAPGFKNDIFTTSTHQCGAQETEILAEKIIINHRMTTVNGIEIEGK